MNIFRVFNTTLYPLFVYLLFSRRNLVESSDAGASPIPGSGTKTGVELSLKAKKATPQFNYNKAGRVVTYTAKDSFGFKSVKTGDKVVWSTSSSDEYATKVVLNGKGQRKKEVTIHQPDGTKKVFEKDKNNPWSEVSQNSNQANGQPGSGTPSSGGSYGSGPMTGGEGTTGGRRMSSDPEGTTGGRRMSYDRDGMTGGGHGMSSDRDGMSGGSHGGSYGTDPNGRGGLERGLSSHGPKDPDEEKEIGGYGPSSSHLAPEASESTDPGVTAQTPGGTSQSRDGSTQVTTPPTNLSGSSTPAPNDGQSSNNLSGGSSASGELKLFKDDGNGNPVEMVEADYERGNVFGCDTYNTKAGVNCTLVKFDDKDVWKKGEQGVDHASSVTYNSRTNNIVVSNGKKLVYYNKNSTGNLVHIRTIDSSRD